MNTTERRRQAIQMAASDPERALSQADDISDHWFASQALALVLRYCPENLVSTVSRRALTRASQCRDAYCRGAVLAWVIRALAEREQYPQAVEVLEVALQEALLSRPAGSRGEALFLLYEAAYPLGCRSVEPILKQLADLQRSEPHWRVSRAFVHAAAMHSCIAPDSAWSIIRSAGDLKLTARIHRHIALGLTDPREFFWQ